MEFYFAPEAAAAKPPPPQSAWKSSNALHPVRWGHHCRVVFLLAALGSSTLVICAALAAARPPKNQVAPPMQKFGPSCVTHGGMPACPALGLFDRPEVHHVAAGRLMRIGSSFLGTGDFDTVSKIVAANFGNISLRLQRATPDLAIAMEMIQLSDRQRDAVLACVQLIGDQQVQELGLHVAQAIHSSPSNDRGVPFLRHIRRQLRPRCGSIKALRDKLIPLALRRLWGTGHLWEMTLDLEDTGMMMQTGSNSFAMEQTQLQSVDLQSISLGLEIGVLEEGRIMIDLIKQIAGLHGKDMRVPAWVTSMAKKVRPEQLSCDLRSVTQNSKDVMKAWLCPLKFGSQGLDALRAAEEVCGPSMGALEASRDANAAVL